MPQRADQIQEMLEGFSKMKHYINLREVCKKHRLAVTHAQWMMLNFIEREGTASTKEISVAFGITSSAVTQIISELIKHSYVTKQIDTVDRRVAVIRLTQATKRAVARAKRAMLTHLVRLFSVLNDREFAMYVRLNKKINNKKLS